MERSRPQFQFAHLFNAERGLAGGDGGPQSVVAEESLDAPAGQPHHGLEHVFLYLSDAVVVVDVTGRILQWNPSAERLFGWTPAEAVGRMIDDVLPTWYPFDDDATPLGKVLTDGAWSGEVVQRDRAGGLLKTMASITLLRGGAGGWAFAVLSFRSIREIRELDQAGPGIPVSSPWRKLVENHPEPIAILQYGNIVHVNPACATLLGTVDPATLHDRSIYDFFFPEHAADVRRAMGMVEAGRTIPTIEHRLRREDGEERIVRSRCVPLLIDGRSVVQAVLHDITEQKLAENALARSEQRFQAVFDRAGIGIAIATPDTRLITTNPAFQHMLQYSAAELTRFTCRDLTYSEDLTIYNHFVQQVHDGEMDRFHMEKRLQRKDGAYAWGSVVATALRKENDELEYFIFLVEDISKRKKTEEELIAARSKAEEMTLLKSSFLTNMSHEIRTPLTGIIGFASILAEEVSEEHRELIELIEQSGHRLLQTLNSILDLSMLESGTLKVKPQEVNIVDEVEALVSQLAMQVEEKGLFLTFASDYQDIRAVVDRTSLDRIINNLVSNAIKFTREGGIHVTMQPRGKEVEIRVEDTGIGIETGFLPYVFDAFRQESTGMARSFEGNGLGLTITKRLVAFMGGAIQVESNPGHGSVFTVLLPMERVADAPIDVSDAAMRYRGSGISRSRPRVLVLEDNRDARVLLQKFLSEKYEVALTSREDQALDAARRQQFDIVLMDINLGGNRTGVDALRALRHLSQYEQVPVVALTAYAIAGDRERFLSQGFDGYLGKPLTKKELYQVISQVLEPSSRS
ncbi:MAG: PAS domain S-box protein [Rhodothermales bacterium]